jgi:hypothetical protein
MNDWHSASDDAALVEFGPVRGLRVSGVGEPGGPEHGRHPGLWVAVRVRHGQCSPGARLEGAAYRGDSYVAGGCAVPAVRGVRGMGRLGAAGPVGRLVPASGAGCGLVLASLVTSGRALGGTAAPDVWAIRSPGSVRQGSGGSWCFPGSPG